MKNKLYIEKEIMIGMGNPLIMFGLKIVIIILNRKDFQ